MEAARTRPRFTTDDYDRMAEAGILTEQDRVELIDGEIVRKMTIGPRHAACVDRATRAFVINLGDTAIVRGQGPVRLGLFSEPEPDIVLLKPRADSYASNHPAEADVLLIIEVADSSLEFDRDVKLPLYAQAGIPEFWLVDLTTDTIFRHTAPRGRAYSQTTTHHRGEIIAPFLRPECLIDVAVLLPD